MPSATPWVRHARRLLATALLTSTAGWAATPVATYSPMTEPVSSAAVQLLGNAPAVAMGSLSLMVGMSLQFAPVNAAAGAAASLPILPQPGAAAPQVPGTMLAPVAPSQAPVALSKVFGSPVPVPLRAPSDNAALAPGALPPAEGFLAGLTAVAFDIDGVAGSGADFWVLADQGFDYFRDATSGQYVFLPARLRTMGTPEAAVTDFAVVLSGSLVEARLGAVLGLAPAGTPLGLAAQTPQPDVHLYLRDALGNLSVSAGFVAASPVPEPGTALLLSSALGLVAWRRCRHRSAGM